MSPRVGQLPAHWAVMRFDVECGADIWEGGYILEILKLLEIRACKGSDVAGFVVVLCVKWAV